MVQRSEGSGGVEPGTYPANFLIEDVSQIGDVLEHRNVATNPTVGTSPALR